MSGIDAWGLNVDLRQTYVLPQRTVLLHFWYRTHIGAQCQIVGRYQNAS
jgi:hypothetical protein